MSYFWVDKSNVLWFHSDTNVDHRMNSLEELGTNVIQEIKDEIELPENIF